MKANDALEKTPLHRCHLQLGARLVPFAGYEMPVQYTGVLEETRAVRSTAGLFDVSHMGQVWVRGSSALSWVNNLVTNRLDKVAEGQAQYNILCNEKGGTIDDWVVYRRNGNIFICVNASNRKIDIDWMKDHQSDDVQIDDVSDETALIALQGPNAESILSGLSPPDTVKNLKYYWGTETKVFDRDCFLSRTGYTGEDGFELYVSSKDAVDVWERLLQEGSTQGLRAIGLGARDTLRLEMGYPLHGHELSPDISPLSAGLSWVVKLDKQSFIGKDALQKEADEGSARVLKALKLTDRRIPRTGYRILAQTGKIIGEITSGTMSPHTGCPIALGFVDKDVQTRDTFNIEIRESPVTASVTTLPFVPSSTKKKK